MFLFIVEGHFFLFTVYISRYIFNIILMHGNYQTVYSARRTMRSVSASDASTVTVEQVSHSHLLSRPTND